MNKILIIGQAPPAVTQTVPYDTTLLYEMLSWVDISKEQAQDMFEFEALVDKFPGHENGQHKKPELKDIIKHYIETLESKLSVATKCILLGRMAESMFMNTTYEILYPNIEWLALPHPSKRNYSLIMNKKEKIKSQLKTFLNNEQPVKESDTTMPDSDSKV